MRKSIYRVLSIVLCLLLICAAGPTAFADNEKSLETPKPGYELIAATDKLTLYADLKNGFTAVKNNDSGYVWFSHPDNADADNRTKGELRQQILSDVVIGYVYNSNVIGTSTATLYASSQVECVEKNSVQVERIQNGIRVVYDFTANGIRIPVEYTLKKDNFKAKIISDEILSYNEFVKEVKNDNFKDIKNSTLLSIWLLPSFGAAKYNDNGYLFIPDGCGATVNFKDNKTETKVYEKLVYGNELALENNKKTSNIQDIKLPVFGIVNGSDAMLGIVTQSDAAASVLAYRSGQNCFYNGVSTRANVNLVAKTMLYKDSPWNSREIIGASSVPSGMEDYEVTYSFLNGENANYNGIAKNYRQFLIDVKGFKKNKITADFNLDLIGLVYQKASFLGIPYNKAISLTNFSQAQKIVKHLQESGIDKISVRYLGWGNSGLVNQKVVKNAAPLSKIGGESGFNDLADYLNKDGNKLYPDVDLLFYQKDGNGISKNGDCAKTVFSTAALQYSYLPSVFVTSLSKDPLRMIAPQKINFLADRYLKNYSELELQNISLSTVGNHVYSDLNSKNGVYRSRLIDIYEKLLKKYESKLNIASQSANQYMLPYTDKILDIPASSSKEDIFDMDIPFYQIVVHGYVSTAGASMNHSYNKRTAFLKAIETGSGLYYTGIYEESSKLNETVYNEYYSTTYSLWAEDAAEMYHEYAPLYKKICDKVIVSHRMVEKDVYQTTYENGVSVIVNYSDNDYTDENGTKIKSYGFREMGGGN